MRETRRNLLAVLDALAAKHGESTLATTVVILEFMAEKGVAPSLRSLKRMMLFRRFRDSNAAGMSVRKLAAAAKIPRTTAFHWRRLAAASRRARR